MTFKVCSQFSSFYFPSPCEVDFEVLSRSLKFGFLETFLQYTVYQCAGFVDVC